MPAESSATYGSTLRSRREALGLTAEQLATCTGRTAKTVALWESGRVTPPRNVRVMIAQALNATDLIEL